MTRPTAHAVLVALILLALAELGAAEGVAAQDSGPAAEDDGRVGAAECCLVLLLPVGARTVGLGQTLTARVAPDAVFANPAGLAGLADGYVVVHHATSAIGQADAVSVLFTPEGVGTVGISYQLVDYGTIETKDPNNVTTGMISLRDHVLVASFATEVYRGAAGGVNFKLYQFRIGCSGACQDQEVVALTYALDAGVRYRPPWYPAAQFGAGVSNAGFALQVINAQQADPPPTRVRIGVAHEVLRYVTAEPGMELWVAVDLLDRWRDPGSPVVAVGMELSAYETVFLRAGYTETNGIEGGPSVGVGLRHARFSIAVAKSFGLSTLNAGEDPVHVSFAMRF